MRYAKLMTLFVLLLVGLAGQAHLLQAAPARIDSLKPIFSYLEPQFGTNGQQLQVTSNSTDLKILSFTVTGKNQHGQMVTKTVTKPYPGVNTLQMSGWWWVGNVTVRVKVFSPNPGHDKTVTCTINVPKSQSSNWVTVRASWDRCWK